MNLVRKTNTSEQKNRLKKIQHMAFEGKKRKTRDQKKNIIIK